MPSESIDNNRNRVFLVHGRDRPVEQAMKRLLRAYGLDPIEWEEAVSRTGEPNPFIGDVLDAAFDHARAIVVLFTPDESVALREELAIVDSEAPNVEQGQQARPNVLFEAGMAMGRDPSRTVLVEVGSLRPFSDIAGRHVLRFDGSEARKRDLASRLTAAGCHVSLRGGRWKAIRFPGPAGSASDVQLPRVTTEDVVAYLKPSPTPGRALILIENHGTQSLESVEVKVVDVDDILFVPEVAPLPFLVPGQRVTLPIVALRGLPDRLSLSLTALLADGTRLDQQHELSLEGVAP